MNKIVNKGVIIFFAMILSGLVGCSSKEGEKLVGDWHYLGCDAQTQKALGKSSQKLSFLADGTFRWEKTNLETGEKESTTGTFVAKMGNKVSMNSEKDVSFWEWSGGTTQPYVTSSDTLKIFVNSKKTQFVLFKKGNKMDQRQETPGKTYVVASSAEANSAGQNSAGQNSAEGASETASANNTNPQTASNLNSQAGSNTTTASAAQSTSAQAGTASTPSPQKEPETSNAPSQSSAQPTGQTSVQTTGQTTTQPTGPSTESQNASNDAAGQAQETSAALERTPQFSRTIDLLKKIEPQRDHVTGYWRLDQNSLWVPPTRFPLLMLPETGSDSYQLELELERLSGQGDFLIGLVIEGRQTVLRLSDAEDSHISGLELVDGKSWRDNKTCFTSSVFLPQQPTKILCRVQNGQIDIWLNDKSVLSWKGKAEALTLDSTWKPRSDRQLFLAAQKNSLFRVQKLEYSCADSP